MRIEFDAELLPDSLFSSSSTRLSSLVMMPLSSSTTELSVGAIAADDDRERSQWIG